MRIVCCIIQSSIFFNNIFCRPRLKIRNRNWSLMPIKLSDNDPQNQDQLRMNESLNNKSGFVLPSGKQLSWLDINKFYPNHTNSPDQLLSTKINLVFVFSLILIFKMFYLK
ncbi:unnamed protein product [Schistosoma margrebowiei]|uniref:Uncharacterized protein n=1 Tax=Schistosoma margrebowiei TaxID=48269 RepID=A0A183LVX7_9TREM|nr:unnamed protein product [Schistosoma margrebowiei]